MPQEAEGCIWGWFVIDAPRPLYLQESAPLPILEKACWALRPDWKCMQKSKSLTIAEVRTPVRPGSTDYFHFIHPRWCILAIIVIHTT
jgi:hypothetical protein